MNSRSTVGKAVTLLRFYGTSGHSDSDYSPSRVRTHSREHIGAQCPAQGHVEEKPLKLTADRATAAKKKKTSNSRIGTGCRSNLQLLVLTGAYCMSEALNSLVDA